MSGKFITFEGIDGAGKSTHVEWLVDLLQDQDRQVLQTREPGGAPFGEKLRQMLLHEEMDAVTETLLMFAARREHLLKVIRPALEAGVWVVCDRFCDASFAYQGGGRGVAHAHLSALESMVLENFRPDLTFLFDLPVAAAAARMINAGRRLDRFEQEEEAFHQRVRDAYLERAFAEPQRICVIDGDQEVAAIRKQLEVFVITNA